MNVQTPIPEFRTHGEIEAPGRGTAIIDLMDGEEEPGIDCGQGR